MTTRRAWRAGLCVFLTAAAASATTTEPNGLVVPVDSNNGEEQLYTYFQSQGETFDWKVDAHDAPDAFSPLCGFTATFVLNQAGEHLGVGWYNADPAATSPPDPTQIFPLINAGDPVGKMVASADIKASPSYKGGLIGFALTGAQTHYSEKKWNVNCSGCATPGPWTLSVTYQSTKTPNAYYLCFEDGNVDASSWSNDGDFNDDVFFFTGITCAGGGQACDTGKPGICKPGVTECGSGGDVTCKELVPPKPETCNAIDDDCNGKVDDGANLCPAGKVCVRGTCVPSCSSGEFACAATLVCDSMGHCVDPACKDKVCPEGQVCAAGQCKGACDGVTCPVGLVCSAGSCVDFCGGVVCESGKVCQGGACVPTCDCSPCAAGLGCDTASGKCLDPTCVGMVCGAGLACSHGACVDPCAGAVCPGSQMCKGGACIAGSGGSAGSGGASHGAGGTLGTGAGGAAGKGGVSVGAGGAGGAKATGGSGGHAGSTGGTSPAVLPANGTDTTADSSGCGCEVRRSGALPWVPALVLAVLVGRRRRREA